MVQVVFSMILEIHRYFPFRRYPVASDLMYVHLLFGGGGGVAIFPQISYILQVPEIEIDFKCLCRTTKHLGLGLGSAGLEIAWGRQAEAAGVEW